MSQIRFYADEHIPAAAILGLQRRGIDIVSTHVAGMSGKSDEAQLALATAQGRVFVTQDDDFLRLHVSGIPHQGIAFVSSRASIGQIVRGLVLISNVLDSEEMRNHVEFL